MIISDHLGFKLKLNFFELKYNFSLILLLIFQSNSALVKKLDKIRHFSLIFHIIISIKDGYFDSKIIFFDKT